MGSEMCIRDRSEPSEFLETKVDHIHSKFLIFPWLNFLKVSLFAPLLIDIITKRKKQKLIMRKPSVHREKND